MLFMVYLPHPDRSVPVSLSTCLLYPIRAGSVIGTCPDTGYAGRTERMLTYLPEMQQHIDDK